MYKKLAILLVLASFFYLSLFSTISFAENITYTPSEETHCINGTCTLTMYSGVRYVFEDAVWKPIENAKSLKSVWNKVYLEKDPDFDIDIVEVNYSYIELALSFNSSNYAKYPECNASKTNDIKCDFKLTVKEDVLNETSGETYKTETKFQYKYQEKNGVKEILKFTQKGIPFGKEYTFGGNSTTITLNETNKGNVGDANIQATFTDYNYGISSQLWSGYNGALYEAYLMWNLSIIPSGSTITNANMSLYSSTLPNSPVITDAYNTSSMNTTGTTYWNEGTLNDASCGSGVNCNLDHNITWVNKPIKMTFQDSNNTPIANNKWISFNVTASAIASFANTTYQRMSIVLTNHTATGTTSHTWAFASKEYTTNTTKRPQLVITYTAAVDTTPPTYSLNSTNSTLAGTPVSHNLKWTDNTGLSGYIFSFDNCTGTLVNDTFVSFSGTTNWSNVTKTINSTVGCTIQWKVYANDTSNNWNTSLTYSYVTTSAAQQYNRTATDYSTSGDASFKLSMLKRKQTDSSALSDLLNDWSKYIRNQAEYATSGDIYKRIESYRRRLSDSVTSNDLYKGWSYLKRIYLDPITSNDLYKQLRKSFKSITDSITSGSLYKDLSKLFRKQSDYLTSLDLYKDLSRHFRKSSDYIASSDLYQDLQKLFRRISDYTTGSESSNRISSLKRLMSDFLTFTDSSLKSYIQYMEELAGGSTGTYACTYPFGVDPTNYTHKCTWDKWTCKYVCESRIVPIPEVYKGPTSMWLSVQNYSPIIVTFLLVIILYMLHDKSNLQSAYTKLKSKLTKH